MENLKPYHKMNQELFIEVCFIGPLKCFGYTCGPPKDFFWSIYVLYLMLCKEYYWLPNTTYHKSLASVL